MPYNQQGSELVPIYDHSIETRCQGYQDKQHGRVGFLGIRRLYSKLSLLIPLPSFYCGVYVATVSGTRVTC